MAEENIMTKQSVGWLEMVNYTGDPFPSGKSTRRGLAFINDNLYYWNGSDFVSLGTSPGGVTTFDELYDNDKTLTLDNGVLTFTVTTAANGIYINKTNAGAGVPLVIANSGSGYDFQGPAWSIISTGSVGILELTSGGKINATGGALTIGKTGTATTFSGTVSIAEGLATLDGAVTFTDDSNAAASVSIVNATATTYAGVIKVTVAALTTGTGILATFAGLTTGTALEISGLDSLTTGKVINVVSNSANTSARSLVCIKNDNTAAVGAIPLETVNDAVTGTGNKFIATIKLGGNTIWRSTDGTSPHGALTATAGDVCLNCDATTRKMMVCTGTNQWAAVTG